MFRSILIGLIGVTFGSLALAQYCDQPYAPARGNWEWQYRISGENATSYILRKTQITDTSFIQIRQTSERKEESKYRCSPEGIVPIDFGGDSVTRASSSGLSADIEVIDAKGVLVPEADSWEVGNSWKYVLELRGTAQQGILRFNVEGNMESTRKVVALEAVTVPAGTFNAYKIQITTQFSIASKLGPISIPFNQSFESISWYAEGVGLVKSIQGKNTTELVALKK